MLRAETVKELFQYFWIISGVNYRNELLTATIY